MPYLSRIWLNPLRPETRGYLRNPRRLHASILGGLAHQPVTERVLWRLETPHQHRLSVLVLTQSTPSWEHLIETAGWPTHDEPQALIRPYDPLLAQINLGREFALRLTANPVISSRKLEAPSPAQQRRLNSQPRPRGVRLPQRAVAHQLTWFTNRIQRWGFTPLETPTGPAVNITARGRLSFPKHDDDTTHIISLQTATYDALVRISDPAAARHSLLHGVGPGKAYGMGLITLAPHHPRKTDN